MLGRSWIGAGGCCPCGGGIPMLLLAMLDAVTSAVGGRRAVATAADVDFDVDVDVDVVVDVDVACAITSQRARHSLPQEALVIGCTEAEAIPGADCSRLYGGLVHIEVALADGQARARLCHFACMRDGKWTALHSAGHVPRSGGFSCTQTPIGAKLQHPRPLQRPEPDELRGLLSMGWVDGAGMAATPSLMFRVERRLS